MANQDELRLAIRHVIKAFERSRRNLMAANMAIHAISSMSPGERKALTAEYIRAELKSIEQQLAQQPDFQFVQIDKALAGDGDMVEPLRQFASGLHW
jgi:hypothetical protein